MQLKALQKKVAQRTHKNARRDKIKISDDYLFLKVSEEFGEMIQSYLIYKRKCRPVKYLAPFAAKRVLAKEIADVAGLLMTISQALKINLEDAIVKKWLTPTVSQK